MEIAADTKSPAKTAPKIQRPGTLDKGVQAEAGDDVEIRLPLTGRPTPSVKVFRDDVRVLDTKHVACTVEEDEIVLVIHSAVTEDSGVYTVVAENEAGADDADIVVKVAGNCSIRTTVRNFKMVLKRNSFFSNTVTVKISDEVVVEQQVLFEKFEFSQ